MMKKTTRFTWLLLTSLLVSEIGYTSNCASLETAHQCMEIADQMHNAAVSNRHSVCADDMEVASAYIEAASNKLYQEHTREALYLIGHGQYELLAITQARLSCPQLALQAQGFLERVNTLKNVIAGWGLKRKDAIYSF